MVAIFENSGHIVSYRQHTLTLLPKYVLALHQVEIQDFIMYIMPMCLEASWVQFLICKCFWTKSTIYLHYKTWHRLAGQEQENCNVQSCWKKWGLEVGEAHKSHQLIAIWKSSCAHVPCATHSKGRKYLLTRAQFHSLVLVLYGSSLCSLSFQFALQVMLFCLQEITCSFLSIFKPRKVWGCKVIFNLNLTVSVPFSPSWQNSFVSLSSSCT